MAKKRSIKVISQSGHNYKATPTIMLKGQWLKELGFDIGDYVSITCENGKLVITRMRRELLLQKPKRILWKEK